MPKITRLEIMKLTSAKDANGKEYGEDNWRSLNVGGQGLMIFAESLHKFPGRSFLSFYFTKLEDLYFAEALEDLNTSYGEIIRDDERGIVWKTKNSTYTFEYEGVTLSDKTRKVLMEYGEYIAQNTAEKEERRKKIN